MDFNFSLTVPILLHQPRRGDTGNAATMVGGVSTLVGPRDKHSSVPAHFAQGIARAGTFPMTKGNFQILCDTENDWSFASAIAKIDG